LIEFRTARIVAGCDMEGNQTLTITAPGNIPPLSGEYDVIIKRHREKRSLNANALFWKMCGSLAEVLHISDEEAYLHLLERYGVKKYIVVKPEAVESVKGLFRAVEEMGGVIVDGKRGVQLKCTVGSSQYDTKQMSRLIEGTASENRELGAFVPDDMDIGASLDLWAKEK